MGISQFRFPMRDADIWGLNDEGQQPDPDDTSANLEFNQIALEDYLSNDLPNVYIQQSDIGSGTIDPAQLASGTPTSGFAPVSNGASTVWTDIATQAELNAVAATITPHPFAATDIQRGTVAWTLGVTDTNTLTTVIFGTVFSVAPVVVTTVLNAADLNLGAELRSVTSAQFVVRVFPTGGVALGASSGTVHWHAVKA